MDIRRHRVEKESDGLNSDAELKYGIAIAGEDGAADDGRKTGCGIEN